jgi:protein TonB
METAAWLKYETRDDENLESELKGTETRVGAVAHNERECRDEGRLPTERETGQPRATESATIMANDLLTYPETESRAVAAFPGGCELDVTFGMALKEKPIWADLYENIRDIFFPPHLPPLELTSTPIPVPDRLAVKPNPWAIGIATSFNLLILALMLVVGIKTYIDKNKPNLVVTPVEVTDFKAPKTLVAAGGGGGSPDKMEAIKGRIPPRAAEPVLAPKVEPQLPSIDVQKDILIPDNPTLPTFGMSNSPNVKLASSGNGSGIGLGNGHGNGYGNGYDGNIGGGLYHVGGGVSAPVALNNVEAEFSDEARRAKYQGVCLISLIVDAQGNPQNPRVIRALGMGLDEKALEAVRQYKFRPAMKDGKTPVAVMITVEVNFRLY